MAEGEAVVLLQSLRIDHGFTAVEYDHGKHHQACKDICTDVYGGKDYMPRMLESYAADENTLMLVATRKGDGAVGGIVCADRRGSIVFLFGLRVCSKFRGRGLASMLVAAASEGVPGAFPQATALMTVTIDANAAAVALFSKALSPAPLYTAEAWPPWTCTYAFESALGWPEKQAGPGDSIIDAVYGARELLCGDAEAAAQLPRWRPTRDVQELSAAVADIRGGGGAGSGSDTGGEGL
ncbi:hypothetical protein FOA52_012126 [Chlamydomonas sp. UWO 241]|nr:hypothetical protein FOA52_012126 [Chlamydomonas sp. UWO 241]